MPYFSLKNPDESQGKAEASCQLSSMANSASEKINTDARSGVRPGERKCVYMLFCQPGLLSLK